MKKFIENIKMIAITNLALIPLVAGLVALPAVVSIQANVSAATEVGISDGANAAKGKGVASTIEGDNGIFRTIVNILLFIVGAVAVIMLVIGGLRYVTSNGDQNAVTGAKNTILYAIIGIVVAFLAYAAVNFVITQLSTNTSNTT